NNNNNNNNNTGCISPVLEWLSGTSTTSASFVARVGVHSKKEITSSSLTVNGMSVRGMKTVKNDGYDMVINENVNLRAGDNEITVTATNACGTTKKTFHVTYNKNDVVVDNIEGRVALVIGNAKYTNHPLLNPANDAADVASSLRNLGFDVRVITNGTKREMEQAISDLSLRAKSNGVALFYYAGHGLQVNGHNYLVPVNATLRTEGDVEYECTDVNRVLANMESSGCSMNILVIDACRDNPFESTWHRSVATRGLTGINAPKGTFIAYATAPGNVANDGTGRNSPYTTAFLNTLKVPGLGIFDFFQQVQASVMKATRDSQVPWVSSSFLGNFYFNPNK
ncbi:MAG: caspase family protein, partial [Bacteroidales bacterium]|nr:caspase family protein [Bacteroidales bacterium]